MYGRNAVDMPSRQATYRIDDQVGFRMRQANQRYHSIFGRHIPGLTPMQFAAVAKLYEVDAVSQNDLGRRTAMDAATMKGVVERLVKKGLVFTRSDPTDLRRLIVQLSPMGREAYSAYVPAAQTITDETLAPLSESEREQFLQLLAKLTATSGH